MNIAFQAGRYNRLPGRPGINVYGFRSSGGRGARIFVCTCDAHYYLPFRFSMTVLICFVFVLLVFGKILLDTMIPGQGVSYSHWTDLTAWKRNENIRVCLFHSLLMFGGVCPIEFLGDRPWNTPPQKVAHENCLRTVQLYGG